MQHPDFSSVFPNLHSADYRITSDATPRYNCIAWAAGKDDNWWWPPGGLQGYHWPTGVPADGSLDSFIQAFEQLGYRVCESDALEPGVEKVAIYVGPDGMPTHAARQLESGAWTSKLGKAQDIEHRTLAGLEGSIYGSVARILNCTRP